MTKDQLREPHQCRCGSTPFPRTSVLGHVWIVAAKDYRAWLRSIGFDQWESWHFGRGRTLFGPLWLYEIGWG